MALSIAAGLCQEMVEHALRESPREACGLLLGLEGRILSVHPARNELGDEARYRIDPRDHFAAIRAARARGLAVMGAFHSHPRSPAVPSPTDREQAWPELVYVIVSLATDPQGKSVRAWQLRDGTFREVDLVSGTGEGERTCNPVPRDSA